MGIFLFLFVWLVQAAAVRADEDTLVDLSLGTVGNDIAPAVKGCDLYG